MNLASNKAVFIADWQKHDGDEDMMAQVLLCCSHTLLHLLLQGRKPCGLFLQQACLPQHHCPQLLHGDDRSQE
jgi:hypothetical protein